jgi:ATP-dependent Zn protease
MELIDAEVVKILHGAADQAYNLLKDHRPDLEKLAVELLDQEELNQAEIGALIGPSVHAGKEHKDLGR